MADNAIIISVDFSERGRATRQLAELEDLPPFQPDSLSLFSDGESCYLLEGKAPPDWEVVARFGHQEVVDYLTGRSTARRRIKQRLQQSSCDHDWWRHNRDLSECRKCRKEKVREKAWTICGAQRIPRMRCRRRTGHDGDCKFSGSAGRKRRTQP